MKARIPAALLLAPACLLAASCAGSSFSRSAEPGAGAGGGQPQTQADSREEWPKLYPVWVEGKTGFIDNTGKLVIPPTFERDILWKGGVFSDGMARITSGMKEGAAHCCRFGYINTKGEVVVGPQYREAEDFSEGLAAVKVGDRWGYIDREGRMALGPKWVTAVSFSEGLAGVCADGGECGYIDKTGAMVVNGLPVLLLSKFSGGMAKTFTDRAGSKFGYIDWTGKLIAPGPFDKAEDFSEGLAAVRVGAKWGYINRTGRFVIEPVYESAGSFSGGTAPVVTGGKAVFIDKSGRTVGECPARACHFPEGLAAVLVGRRWGYIDKTGRFVVEPQFHEAYNFSGGIAMVKPTVDMMGYIDKTGRYVWKPTR